MRDYTFTIDMAAPFRVNAANLFSHLIGTPARYLEIGVYEGRSGCWMLDHILTHPDSVYVGVDERPWSVAEPNLGLHAHRRMSYVCEDAATYLPRLVWLGCEPFDAIYIDGDHREEPVYRDIKNAWDLVRVGGVILCDDYALTHSSTDPEERFGVREAAERFLAEVGDRATVLCRNYQIGWRREK